MRTTMQHIKKEFIALKMKHQMLWVELWTYFWIKINFVYIQDISLETQLQNQILTKSGISLALFLCS